MPKRSKESYARAGMIGAKASWSGVRSLPMKDRFWRKIKVGKPDECWPWKRAKKNVYGVFRFHNRRLTASHRVAYELTYGPIPEGLDVCHDCDHRPCCNPAHLFVGTAKDNLDDAMQKGRMAIGQKHGNAKLTDAKVKTILKLRKNGVTQREVAARYKVSQSIISDIVRCVSWKHIQRS